VSACSSRDEPRVFEGSPSKSAVEIAARSDAVVAPIGAGRAVAYGGSQSFVDDNDVAVYRDAAIIDLETRLSTPLPESPPPLLGHVVGSAAKHRLLVAGVECAPGPFDNEDDHVGTGGPCPVGRLGVGRLDVNRSTWDLALSAPLDVIAGAVDVSVIGSTGPTIVVVACVVRDDRERAVVVAYDTRTRRWSRAPSRALGRVCWTGGAVVSLAGSRVAVWRPGAARWKSVPLPELSATSVGPYLWCTENYAVVDSMAPAGRRGRVVAYEPATGTWTDLPPKPPWVPGSSQMIVGDRLALWNETAPAGNDLVVHVLDVSTPRRGWVDIGKPPQDRLALMARVAAA
jgi:hypothetical protein